MTKSKPLPDLDTLISILKYNSETGKLTWIVRPSTNVYPGDEAGRIDSKGYRVIGHKGMYYKAHRIAWKMHYGYEPMECVDHINGDTLDNSICNLRSCSTKDNVRNSKIQKDNTTGYKGVSMNNGRYRAKIWKDGKDHVIGVFDSPLEAHKAYCKIAKRWHGEFFNQG